GWRWLAIGWHVWLAMLTGLLVAGWRPSVRTAGWLLSAPLVSVATLAWLSGNPFTGTMFAGLAVGLALESVRSSNAPVRLASPAWIARGAALVGFGATYPHFLQADSPADYVVAAPFGLLPCPTLSVVIGSTLLVANLGSRRWNALLLAVAVLYAAIGVFRLGVALDWGLFIGAALLVARMMENGALWRSVRADGAEHARPLPGDDRIADPLATLTHAITIHCGPRAVWPWLVQMGAGSRAGWYSYDFLDNGRHPSATRVIPDLQSVAVGTVFPALPGVTEGFKVLSVEPPASLVLGWPLATGAPVVTWAFVLEPRPGPATRLIVRVRGGQGYRFHGLPGPVSTPLVRAVHFLMQRRQLLGIAQRAESTAPTAPYRAPVPEPEGHRV
ncbi:MAG TPA: hypothetical protein VFO31_08550, partial [Vicinamibacterales bacterium]|nr:hypothetical protein [Vicinamibacterales bacterium]